MQSLIISQNAMKSADFDAIHLNNFLPKWSTYLNLPLEITLVLNQPLKKIIPGINIIIAPSLPDLKVIITKWSQQQFLSDKTQIRFKWFSYHGHGYSGSRSSSDPEYRESDNSHEYIHWGGQIFVDHEIRNCLFNSCHFPVTFFCLMDCCSSGTMLDLPLVENYPQKTWRTENSWKISNDIKIVNISACSDNQYDMDDISDEGYGGGLLSAWFDSFRTPLKWNERIENIRNRLKLLNQTFTLSVAHETDMIQLSKLIDPDILSKSDTPFTFAIDLPAKVRVKDHSKIIFPSEISDPFSSQSYPTLLNISIKSENLGFSPRQLNETTTLLSENSQIIKENHSQDDQSPEYHSQENHSPKNPSRQKESTSENISFSFIIICIILMCILIIFIGWLFYYEKVIYNRITKY